MEHSIMVVASLLAAGLTLSAAVIGASFGNSYVISKFIEGLTRQPEAKNVLLVNTLISVGLIEAVPIIATVMAIVMLFANPLL